MNVTRRTLLEFGAASALLTAMPLGRVLGAAPINLGFQITTWGAVGMVAETLNSFDKHNVPVAVHKFDSGVAVRDAMVAGRVDIGVSSVSTFIVGVDKGDLAAIATVAYAGASNSIMVAKGSDIQSVPDLKGKKVATQFGSGADYTFRTKVLEKFNITPTDLQLVNVKFADHVAALASGSVDAFVGTEPFPAVVENKGIARTLITFEDYDIVPVMLAIRQSVLKERRADVVAFMRGWLDAVELFRTDMDKVTDIVWQVFKDRGLALDKPVLRIALNRLGVNPDFVAELEPYLNEQAKALVDQRKISRMPDWSVGLDRGVLVSARKG